MDNKSLIIGALIAIVTVVAIGGTVYVAQDTGNQSSNASEPVNESGVPPAALDSKAGAADLKHQFSSEYSYNNSIYIQNDGQVILSYQSSAQNGNQLKDEMRQVTLLYAQSAANHTNVGALTIQANGVTLTVPADTAIAHGNGDINQEAYFENMMFSTAKP